MENSSTESRLSAALGYANRGWRVFPLKPNTKVPLFKGSWPEYATDQSWIIRNWWELEPDANIAIVAGDKLTVLDADRHPGKPDGVQVLNGVACKDTPAQVTANGGIHYFHQNPGYRLKACPGVDVQQGNAYVVAAPSVVDGKPYYWFQDPSLPPKPFSTELLAKFQVASETPVKAGDMPLLLPPEETPELPLERLKEAHRAFLSGGQFTGFNSRSEVIHSLATRLYQLGWNDEQVLSGLWAHPMVQYVARKHRQGSYERGPAYIWESCKKVRHHRRLSPQEAFSPTLNGSLVPMSPFAPLLASGEATATAQDLLRYMVLVGGVNVADLRLPSHQAVMKLQAFREKFAYLPPVEVGKKFIPATKWWQQQPDRWYAAGEGFNPNAGQIYKEEGQAYFNTFHMPEHPETLAEDQIGVFLEHMAFLFPEDDRRELMLDWFAFNVQHPGERIQWTPLLVSNTQGIGKSWLAYLMSQLLGDWNCQTTKVSRMAEDQWHNYLHRSLFCVVHETREPRKEAFKVNDKLRDLLTEPRLELNLKYGQNGTQTVYTNFLLLSNHMDALVLPPEDRRIWVHVAPNTRRADRYYAQLFGWLKGPGPGQLFWFLKRRDLAGFNPGAEPPRTPEKVQMSRFGMSPVEQALRDVIAEDVLDVATFPMVERAVRERLGQHALAWDAGHLKRLLQENCTQWEQGKKLKLGEQTTRVWLLSPKAQEQFSCTTAEEVRNRLMFLSWIL